MSEQNTVSRRTLAKGAAWAVPAAAVVAAAPAYALSKNCATVTFGLTACKVANLGLYKIGFKVCATGCTTPTVLNFAMMANSGGKILRMCDGGAYWPTTWPTSIRLGPGECTITYPEVWFKAASMGNDVYFYASVSANPDKKNAIASADAPQGGCALPYPTACA